MSDPTENNNLTGYEIAVIGMAGRFPGASSIDEFWQNLENGSEGIGFFSEEELEETGIPSDLLENPGYVKAKAALEDVDCFDASFFNYTLREAEIMDPQLRILQQCSWRALEDAGYNPDTYDGLIGFYGGANTHYYWLALIMDRVKNPSETFGAASLNDGYSISTQVSYRLNLKGPALTLQTACSTSLVAIHTACQALLSGECHMALAGGVSVKLPNKIGYTYQEGMVLSPDGHCRTFDAKAAGCFEGNGVGMVVLKPLENALENRDHIYALVKGTAINNDGNRRVGFSAPSVLGQADVIRTALKAAEVEPESISYVEAHGTGTTLGDPVEIRALVRAFNTKEKQFCRSGSVKINIGHLDAAAGEAGFIKTILALHHRLIPPSLHFETPNPEVDFKDSPFIVNTKLTGWKNNGHPLRAGVSSFGIGGTNAHVVLEEAPVGQWVSGSVDQCHPQLLLISAGTEAALDRNTHNLVEYLKKNPDINFADAAYTLQVGRKPFEHRRTLVCRDVAEAVKILSAGNSKKVHTHRVQGENPPVVFMFSGLGSQYVNMGCDLYQDEPVFRETMDRCFEIVKPLLGYDLKNFLYPVEYSSRGSPNSDAPATCNAGSHLSLFIFEYALAKLLMQWGIAPHAMIGYSFGEYTAACAAGVFTLEEVLQLIIHRGQLIDKSPEGAMSSVPLSREELLPLLPKTGEISLAIDNGTSCIVAGPKEFVEAFEKKLKQEKYLCMRLNTSQAIHSPLMNPILTEFAERAKEISLKEPQIPYISNLTGKWISPGEATDPAYWARHLAGTVRFNEGILELVKEPQAIFLELGPGRDLSALIQRSLGENHQVINLVRPQQKEIADTAYLLDRFGLLWLYGKAIDWQRFHHSKGEGKQRCRVPLPTYSFEPQRFVLEIGKGMQPVQSVQPQPLEYNRSQLPGDYEVPRDQMEEKIAEAFKLIFGLGQISIHDDFFELGGDSLKVITLVTDIHQQLDIDIPMDAVFKNPTVEELAGYAGKKAEKTIFAAIPPVEKKEYSPQSPSQRRIFIMELIEEKGMAYNQPTATFMEGSLDPLRLENTYKELVKRHESLRTGFFLKDGVPVQRVYDPGEIEFGFELFDIAGAETRLEKWGERWQEKWQEKQKETVDRVITDFVQPFDLSQPPLWRAALVKLAADKYLLVDMIHHIISDDISVGILMTEISRLYAGKTLKDLPVRYKDYQAWQAKIAVTDNTLEKQKQYWLDLFSDAPHLPVLDMPPDYPRPEVQRFEGGHAGVVIDAERRDKLHELARKNKTTLFVLLFSIYNTLLYTYTDQEDIIVGIPITGRSHRDVQDVVGIFVNTLALRNHPAGNQTFTGFLQQVKESTLNAFSNQFYQFEELVEQLNLQRDTSRNPLFDAMFVLHTVNIEKINLPDVELHPYGFEHPGLRFDITLNAAEFSRGLTIGLEYSTALFKEETMLQFLDDYVAVLEMVLENPQKTLDELSLTYPGAKKRLAEKGIANEILKYFTGEEHKSKIAEISSGNGGIGFANEEKEYEFDISGVTVGKELVIAVAYDKKQYQTKTIDTLLEHYKREFDRTLSAGSGQTEEEKKRVLNEFNDTAVDYPGTKTIHELFDDQVVKTPDNIAVMGVPVIITYRELNEKAGCLARLLRTKGLRTGAIAGVIFERSKEMMIGIFGVLKAGGAYLPIDPFYPEERIAYMLKDSSVKILLSEVSRVNEVSEVDVVGKVSKISKGIEVIEMRSVIGGNGLACSADLESSSPAAFNVGAHLQPAYVIYTSGSTGKPKGVVIEHHSVANRLNWMQKAYPIDKRDIILQKTPIVFDVSVWELFWWSFQGAAICMLEPEEERNPESIIAAVGKNNVTTVHFVPSMLNTFLAYLESSDENSKAGLLDHLKTLHRVFASGEALAVHHVERFNKLLNETGKPMLVNLYGPTEATVDVSYFNCFAGETHDRIPIGKPIDNTCFYILDKNLHLLPVGAAGELCISGVGVSRGYLNNPELTNERFIFSPFTFHLSPLYKTGDLARWLPDGNVEFLARIDHQVKIRGFRIELGEIENRLLTHEKIKEAAVLAKEEENGEKYLCAYIVSAFELEIFALRLYLAKNLPDYMIPSYFIQVKKMPLTPNGKIDRKALAEVEGFQPKLGAPYAYVAPETELEKNIAETWKRALKLDKIGIDDNFFDIGGNSLKLIRVVGELKASLKKEMPVVTMFRYPTIGSMANFLSQEQAAPQKRDRTEIKKKGRERLKQKRSLRQ